MATLLSLPLFFWVVVTGMTVIWHKINVPNFRQSSSMSLRLSQIDLVGAHFISLLGLYILCFAGIDKTPKMWLFWLVAGLLVFFLATVMKVSTVKALPDNLWHFTERNRQLVVDGRIVRFHVENDLAAVGPLLFLLLLAITLA